MFHNLKSKIKNGISLESTPPFNTCRLRVFVGWVKRQRNPTKVRKCWVS
ncbi:hypothetical protein [Trichormus sp. NMC-1]|nr:hypothetical protein [Trichormus sp. NMC-1]